MPPTACARNDRRSADAGFHADSEKIWLTRWRRRRTAMARARSDAVNTDIRAARAQRDFMAMPGTFLRLVRLAGHQLAAPSPQRASAWQDGQLSGPLLLSDIITFLRPLSPLDWEPLPSTTPKVLRLVDPSMRPEPKKKKKRKRKRGGLLQGHIIWLPPPLPVNRPDFSPASRPGRCELEHIITSTLLPFHLASQATHRSRPQKGPPGALALADRHQCTRYTMSTSSAPLPPSVRSSAAPPPFNPNRLELTAFRRRPVRL
jgi:hypothetical protein